MGKTKSDLNWRTPSAQEPGIKVERLKGELGKRLYDKETGRNAQYGLSQQVSWATPNAADCTGTTGGGQGRSLRTDISQTQRKGKLNPDWVEQLMGLPVGWTQLSSATDPHENRIDRLRLLGNGVVPQTAEKAFRTLLERLI